MKRWSILSLLAVLFLAIVLQAPSTAASPSRAAATTLDVSFVENAAEPFGTFDGVAFVRHTGLFEGETSLGAFRMPYEIVAPEDPALGNGSVLVEPPHFAFGPFGRDLILGRDLVFQTVSGYASVGFGEDGLNILDPSASDLLLAGAPVEGPGEFDPAGILDEEILIQFTQALSTHPYAVDLLGDVSRLYAHGTSQTAALLLETQRNLARTERQGLFDFTLLHTTLWGEAPVPGGTPFDFLSGEFEPVEGVGKVVFVETEGDQILSDAEQFRRVVGVSEYRLYEVAGAAHLPTADNPLDHNAVARAMFAAGDRWVRSGTAPPSSMLMESAPAGQIDPVYGEETGIARDGDLNAQGGVRLPDLHVGRAQFIASDPTTPVPDAPPVFFPLSGNTVDLVCEPEPDSDTDEPRFGSHGEYVSAFTQQVNELRQQGFLLEAAAEGLKERAAASDVGKPGTCE